MRADNLLTPFVMYVHRDVISRHGNGLQQLQSAAMQCGG